MNIRTKIKRFLLAPDFCIAFIGAIFFALFANGPISSDLVKEITSTAITILSIIFSVFFAALAVMITSGDNEFINFLQRFGAYTQIVWSFKVTFFALLIALLSSLILYLTSIFQLSKPISGVYPWFFTTPYIFLTFYALLSTAAASVDAIKYAEYRTKYLLAIEQMKNNSSK